MQPQDPDRTSAPALEITGAGRASDAQGEVAETHREIGVYVHFPWCLKKCPYCDFLSVASAREEINHDAYADSVLAEFGRRASALGERKLRSVFFGGGTPSLWRPSALGRVLYRLREHFGAHGTSLEVTVECNPSSFDGDVARALFDVGVNRVSIGVQSLSQNRLQFLGRLHDADGALAAVRAAVESPIPRVSADLIYGVVGQSADDASEEVQRVADLGITHLSAYTLTIEPGTQFGALAKRGRLPLLGDDIVADSYVRVHDTLTGAGFEHYEVSNFAREGQVSVHNLGYWRGRDYLGLGAGAWGTVPHAVPRTDGTRRRYRNTLSPERYLSIDWQAEDLDESGGHAAQASIEDISPETAVREMLMLGLRLSEGVNPSEIAHRTGAPVLTPARSRVIQKKLEQGLLERVDQRLRVPEQHWLLADGIVADLM